MSGLEESPEEDPSKDDSSGNDVFKIARLEEIPFGRPYRTHTNKWIATPPTLSSGSSLKYSSLLFGSSSSAPSLPYSRPSRKRSHYVSSSLETSHPSSLPPPYKRRRVMVYSSSALLPPSPSVGPSRKRCRFATLPLPAIAAVSTPHIEMLPPRKSKMIGEMYECLLDIPFTRLEDTKHELENLIARVVLSEREVASLLAKARAAEQRDEISGDKKSKLEDRLRPGFGFLGLSPDTRDQLDYI
nr:hypothetical protein [Tanacetum cinerariifolium]